MPHRSFLLRFDSHSHAEATLASLGIPLNGHGGPCMREDSVSLAVIEIAFGDGIIRKPTGETGEFEGETIALTTTAPGFHLLLACADALPQELFSHLVGERQS
jgi:hypothetical protein